SVDVADVTLVVLYLEYKRLRLTTWKVAVGMMAATAVMIGANVRSVWPDPTAVLMQAWVPTIALWLWHTLAAGRKPRGEPLALTTVWARVTEGVGSAGVASVMELHRTPAAQGTAGVGPDEFSAEQTSMRNRPARVPARAEVRRLLKRNSNAVTAEQIARRVGVSIPHARRLPREGLRIHIVTAEPLLGTPSDTEP